MKFNKNDIIKSNGSTMKVLDLLGDGGQGEVYLVDYNHDKYALKIYKDMQYDDFKNNLKSNIEKGSPSDSFLWPKKLIELEDGNFGYLMDLRPSNYSSFVSYLNGKDGFKDRNTMIKWCIELCTSFKKLHEMGYSYQDLNDGSFFFDGDTGDLLICDNDNVTANQKNLGVLGKIKYMAPEIVRGDSLPDTHSDRFSLAVILFMTLCLGNPFEGERLKNYNIIDEKAELELYGTKPLFVYHKTDKSNRPVRGYHGSVLKRWPTLPTYIKEAFHRTFVDGLQDRENGRTTELEWIKQLCKYRDELISCPNCGVEYIKGLAENKPNLVCPYCGANSKKLSVLVIGKTHIVLELGKKIYKHHIDKYSSDYLTEVGVVIANKNNPSLWGIRISLNHDILIKDSKGVEKTIQANGVIPIVKDLKIKFSDETIGVIYEQ